MADDVTSDPLDAALDRAFDTAFAAKDVPAEAVEAVEVTDAPVTEGPARGPDGKFVAKAAEAVEAPVEAEVSAPPPEPVEAPAWLNDANAKAVWGQAPQALRDHLGTRFADMEKGIGEYRAKFEPLRQYAEMAEAQGTTLADAMQRYVGIEQALAADPVKGLDTICQNLGFSLRDVAAHVMGQPAPEVSQQVQQLTGQMREMQAKLSAYEAKERREQEQSQAKAQEAVDAFAAQHPRYAELEHTIAWALKTAAVPRTGDAAADLANAYQFAERLVPAPAAPSAPAATAAPAASAAPAKKAGISIDGAPGSNPTVKPKSRNSNEAVDRAFDQLGL